MSRLTKLRKRYGMRKRPTGGIIRTTYEIVTPESAEDGEAAESGWKDENGMHYTVQEAIRLLEGSEPSSSSFHPGIWYTQRGDTDYRTGGEESDSYHLVNWPEKLQRKVYDAVKPRGWR